MRSFLPTLGSKGIQQSLITLVGSTVAAGISAVAMILISRMLGPEQFGVFSVGFAIVLMLARINDLGLTFAQQKFVPRTTDPDEHNRIFSFAVQTKLVVAGLILVIGWLITPWLTQMLDFSEPVILYLSFLLSIATVMTEQLAAMLQSLHRFFQAVVVNMSQAMLKLVLALLLVVSGAMTSVTAFVGYMAAPFISLLLIKRVMPKSFKLTLAKKYASERRLMRSIAGHAAIGFVAAGLIENIDILFVQGMLDEYQTGLLGGAARIALLFMMIAFSLATVLNPRVARYTTKEHLRPFSRKALMLVAGCGVGFLLSVPMVKPMIWLTIGPAYYEAALTLVILLAASFVTLASVPFIAMFFSFERADWYFSVSGISQLLIILVGNLLLVPMLGIVGAAWARLFSKLFLFGFTAILALWYYRRVPEGKIQNSKLKV